MTDKKTSSIPFVGLHAHSGFSLFDGFGFPGEHLDFAYSNGLEAHAFTEHGNMNSFSYAWTHVRKMKKEDKKIKFIKGVEAYFIPSFYEWRKTYEEEKEAKKEAKKEDLGSFSENEEETKSAKPKSAINRKSHLVILAKNKEGLKNLFKLVSRSFQSERFYRVPRMDFEMLRENREGLIIGSACVSGETKVWTNDGKIEIKQLIEKIQNGKKCFILSYNEETKKGEYKEVVWGDKTRKNAKVLLIKLSNGKKIKCTEDHKIFTSSGWKEAGKLTKEDKILSIV